MSIPGKQTINVGLPNEPANSDSLYTAFTKTEQNFANLFACASPYNTFTAGPGILINANSTLGTVSITNLGVTNIVAGDNILISQSNGNVTISATGSGNGGALSSVGITPVSNGRLVVTNSPLVTNGNINIDLASSGVSGGTYSNPTLTVDNYGRITSAANGNIAGTVNSVGLTAGSGIQVSGGPITSNGNITVTNTGVTRINPGAGISVSSGNGDVTISATTLGGTVTAVGISSDQLVVAGSPVVSSGTISVNLPANANFAGNVTANYLTSNGGNINGNLIVAGNISPAAVGKVGGIKPGPGVDISLDGELTIDTANLPLSFGNFTANNNVLSIVNVDEDMILQTEGNAEIQLVGNIGFYKPDGIPPNVANRYFSATGDGQIQIFVSNVDPTSAAVNIIGSTSGNFSPPVNDGVMLQLTGQANTPSRFYNDGIGNFAAFVGRRINGTVNSPTAVQAGDELIRISSTGYNGTTVSGNGTARIVFQAMENFTTSNSGSNLSFWTAAIGSNTLTKIATIDNANGLVATKVVSTGNANVGNLGFGAGQITGTGNITAGNLIGTLANGNSNVNIPAANGNVNISAVGNANIVVVTGTGANITGTLNATGNANVGNIGATTAVVTTANVTGNVNAGNLVLTTGNIIYTPRYGSFYSNVDQTNPVANTAMAMTFNNTVAANGISVVSNSRLTIAKTGVYNIQFSAQVAKSGGGTSNVDIWLNKDGSPVAWTNTVIPVTSGSPQVAAWNFVENVTVANTYFELMWSSPDTLVLLDSQAANTGPTRPGVPSVIVSVTPVGA